MRPGGRCSQYRWGWRERGGEDVTELVLKSAISTLGDGMVRIFYYSEALPILARKMILVSLCVRNFYAKRVGLPTVDSK